MFRSEYADVPHVELPIHDAVLGRAAEFGELPALVDGTDGTTLTYDQLDRFHRRVAAALADAGVRKGDVLALHSPNTVAFPIAFYAATRAGATVTTVHPLATAEEFAKQLGDSAARWIVTVSPLLQTARRAAELAGGVEEIFVCDNASGHRSLIDMLGSTAPSHRWTSTRRRTSRPCPTPPAPPAPPRASCSPTGRSPPTSTSYGR